MKYIPNGYLVGVETKKNEKTAFYRRQDGGKKVKCTLVQALRLCTGRTAHRGSRGIAILYRH